MTSPAGPACSSGLCRRQAISGDGACAQACEGQGDCRQSQILHHLVTNRGSPIRGSMVRVDRLPVRRGGGLRQVVLGHVRDAVLVGRVVDVREEEGDEAQFN